MIVDDMGLAQWLFIGSVGLIGGFIAFLIRLAFNLHPRRAIRICSASGESIEIRVSSTMSAQKIEAIIGKLSELDAPTSGSTQAASIAS